MSRAAGISEDKLQQIGAYESSAVFTPQERAALRLADALVSTPANVDDALFTELRAHFSEEQLVELSSAIAWENYRARFNRVFDVESEDYSEGAFCPTSMSVR